MQVCSYEYVDEEIWRRRRSETRKGGVGEVGVTTTPSRFLPLKTKGTWYTDTCACVCAERMRERGGGRGGR